MESINDYAKWLRGLGSEEREKYEFLEELSYKRSEYRKLDLMTQYNIRLQFFRYKYPDPETFAREELVQASRDLTSIDFPCDWGIIDQNIAEIGMELIGRANADAVEVVGDILEIICDLEGNPKPDEELRTYKQDGKYVFEINHEDEMPVLFKSLLYGSGLAIEYMSHDFSECDPLDYDISQLRDFDKIIEILARFKWLVSSWNIVEEETYDKPATDKTIPRRTLADIVIQYIWEGRLITMDNKDEIAAEITKAGVLSLKNGNKLYNNHCDYIQNCNRTGDLGDDKKNRNHYQTLLRAYKNLKNKEHQQVAEKEISTFKDNALRNSGTKF